VQSDSCASLGYSYFSPIYNNYSIKKATSQYLRPLLYHTYFVVGGVVGVEAAAGVAAFFAAGFAFLPNKLFKNLNITFLLLFSII
jgi:hypothetical protein